MVVGREQHGWHSRILTQRRRIWMHDAQNGARLANNLVSRARDNTSRCAIRTSDDRTFWLRRSRNAPLCVSLGSDSELRSAPKSVDAEHFRCSSVPAAFNQRKHLPYIMIVAILSTHPKSAFTPIGRSRYDLNDPWADLPGATPCSWDNGTRCQCGKDIASSLCEWNLTEWNPELRPIAPLVRNATATPVYMGPIHVRLRMLRFIHSI